MKVVSFNFITTFALLVTTAIGISGANLRARGTHDTKRNRKKSTIFHKNIVDANKGTSAEQTILDKVSTARTQRRGLKKHTTHALKEKDKLKASDSSPSKRQRRTRTPEQRIPNPRPGHSGTNSQTRLRRNVQEDKGNSECVKGCKSSCILPPTPTCLANCIQSTCKDEDSVENKECTVQLTNLSKEQWFSDIFWMVHSDKVELPLWSYGSPVFDDLAVLATDGDPYELVDFYEWNNDGVFDVDAIRGPLKNGDSLSFGIPKSGSHDLFTMATSFIFSNDGFVSIDAGEIKDDATWFLWGLDAGVEANTQLCWTVQASSIDFPPNSECFYVDEDIADENDNSFPGEGFVHVHSGIHDMEFKNDLEDFLALTPNPDFIYNAFETLEPQVFDFRTPMMKVEMKC